MTEPEVSSRPGGVQDDLAKIGALELRIFVSQHVIVHGAKGAIRPMLHAVIEGVNNVLFEVIAAGMGGHHAKPQLFVKVGEPENVHLDAGGDECHHRLLMLGDARRLRSATSNADTARSARYRETWLRHRVARGHRPNPCTDRSGHRTGRPVWSGDREGRAACRELTPLIPIGGAAETSRR